MAEDDVQGVVVVSESMPSSDGVAAGDGQAAQAAADAASMPDGAIAAGAIGRVASPIRFEATSGRFYFWIPRGGLAERTQLVWTISVVGGRQIAFYGVVDEVYRRSRKRSIDDEVDAYDGDLDYQPPFGREGVTFAEVTVLRTEPPYLTPPLEESLVFLGGEAEAAKAYGYDVMVDPVTQTDWGLPIGLLRNGASVTVGVAKVDLRDLCGDRAGHANVTGQAGHGTKSSFLLMVVRSLVDFARHWDDGDPKREPFSVRPIVFNVKGNDLMYIDAPNRYLSDGQRKLWKQMGLDPRPFAKAQFFAPCQAGAGPVNRGLARVLRPGPPERQAQPYYWKLADVVRFGLWSYLFSEDVQQSEAMTALADHILGLIAELCDASKDYPAGLRLRSSQSGDIPQSFAALRDWLRQALRDPQHLVRDHGIHTFGTCRALLSRLGLVLGREGTPIFDDGVDVGAPLQVLAPGTTDPLVIDIAGLPAELRRFVVAAVLDQVKEHQIGPQRIPGQVYFLVLDELGIYAPRGARDPITRLFEHVAAQLRSQGIILLGAQQQASKVSETIFGNSELKVLGATSPVELETPAWAHLLTPAQKSRALALQPEEKMVLARRGWMNVLVPFPAWAMKESEVDRASLAAADGSVPTPADDESTSPFRLKLPEGGS